MGILFYIPGLLWKIILLSKAFQNSWLNTIFGELIPPSFQVLHNQHWLVILDIISVYPSLEEAIKTGGKKEWGEAPLEN